MFLRCNRGGVCAVASECAGNGSKRRCRCRIVVACKARRHIKISVDVEN